MPRIAARVGKAQARVAAMLLLTLRGTPTMYYGDEIGLDRAEIPPERVQDPWERNEPGLAKLSTRPLGFQRKGCPQRVLFLMLVAVFTGGRRARGGSSSTG